MKLFKQKSIKYQTYTLLKLHIIKTKIYKSKNSFELITITEIEKKLKKSLQILYKYHVKNKRIIFVGTPLKLNKQLEFLFKKTKHITIPESVWVNGMITNQALYLKYIRTKTRKILKLTLKLRKKNDLIVILNKSLNFDALKESRKVQIPAIVLNSNETFLLSTKGDYDIPGHFSFTQKQIRDNFFYLILMSVFKKAQFQKNVNK